MQLEEAKAEEQAAEAPRSRGLRLTLYIGPAVALTLFCAAAYVLRRELKLYRTGDVIASFRGIPHEQVVLASVFCLASYLVLTFYDVLAIRYVGQRLAYYRIALASFIGYTFSHNLGFSVLTGGAARYRLFSSWGLSAKQIAQAIAFSGVTFWFGFALLAGIIFIVDPPSLPESILPGALVIQPASFQILGVLLLIATAGYLYLWGIRRKPLRIKEFEFPAPALSLSVVGLLVAALDWSLAAAVTYSLLPPGVIPFWQFVGVFQAAQIIGLLSHVPGGLGIFETLIIAFYSKSIGAGELLGILLAYRVIYYVIPLSISLVLFVIREVFHQFTGLRPIVFIISAKLSRIVPTLASVLALLAGTILLLSGATPALRPRLEALDAIVPLPLIEGSHFIGSIVGLTLLLLARGLQRRLDSAYILTVVFLAVGGIVSLLKGLDYEEAGLLIVMWFFIAPFHGAFYRKSAFLEEMFTPGWIVMVVVILAATTWVAYFSFRHVEYSQELWWEFSLGGDAPRALRALVGISSVFLLGAGIWMLAPVKPSPPLPTPDDLKVADELLQRSTRTYAALALLGDKRFLFSRSRKAFIMYGIEGRTWISYGDPVGEKSETSEVIWRLRELADEHNGSAAFYQIHPEYLPYYVDIGLDLMKVGEEAIVHLEEFTISGNSNSGFRSTRNKVNKLEYSFSIVPVEQLAGMLGTLREISDSWLEHLNAREKGFSLGFFSEEYLRHFPVAVVRKQDRICAFANILTSADKFELSVDLMRYAEDAPPGVIDYLFIELMMWGKEQGYKQFNLGMAPFSGLETHPLGPAWSRLGALLYRRGEHFYNFRGVRKYKEKFHPDWQPRYLAAPGGIVLARVLTNVATLISGGIRGLVAR